MTDTTTDETPDPEPRPESAPPAPGPATSRPEPALPDAGTGEGGPEPPPRAPDAATVESGPEPLARQAVAAMMGSLGSHESVQEPSATAARTGNLPAAPQALVKRHHGLVRVAHWANAVLLAGMIGSGLQIYGAYRYLGPRGGPFYPNPWNGKSFPPWATLGGWLAGGLNWHFFLAWPFVLTGAAYLFYLLFSGEWRSLLFRPADVPRAVQMQLYYLRLRREHPPQGKHNALQKAAYTFILFLGAISVATGFAIYKPDQLAWLTSLFGGYELARFWHFWAVFVFLAFTLVHVSLVLLVDPASLRAMITGWYRGRFPSHD
jgi:thiosulfate reductase cytochrome b subunit